MLIVAVDQPFNLFLSLDCAQMSQMHKSILQYPDLLYPAHSDVLNPAMNLIEYLDLLYPGFLAFGQKTLELLFWTQLYTILHNINYFWNQCFFNKSCQH